MSIEPGWYRDPADPSTQRYWDGEGWLGEPLPAEATPPASPPPASPASAPPAPLAPAAPIVAPAPPSPEAPQPVNPAGPGAPTPGPLPEPGAPSTPYSKKGVVPRPHGLTLAGPGARFVARIIDVIAVLLLCVIANAWFGIQFWRGIQPTVAEAMRRGADGNTSTEGLPMPPESTGTLLLMMLFAITAVWFAYEVPGSANSGQTLGKRMLGIKVVRLESEERLGFGRAFRRWARLGLPTLLWYCWGVGLLLQAIDCLFLLIDRPLNQALHDKTAATVVVRVPRPGQTGTTPLADATRGGRHADPS